MSSSQTTIPKGRYRHYKGQEYQVIDVACHSETRQWLVVYRCLYGDYSLWVRPYEMFTESVLVTTEQGESASVPRFAYMGPMLDE